jgi:hypothetical protein
MHFTTLGYSRPDGQTSDHWDNVAKLQWEPEFFKYVRDSFAPVGLCIDFWDEQIPAGKKVRVPVIVSNDLDQWWTGSVILRLKNEHQVVASLVQTCRLKPLGQDTVDFELTWPEQGGPWRLEAEMRGPCGTVRSVREPDLARQP